MSSDDTVVVQRKSTVTAHLFWLFLGLLGAHRFYLNDKKAAWWMVFCLIVGFGWHWLWVFLFLWWLHDGIILGPWVRDYNNTYGG
jgi:TM2 domain-containing membrane protein YozV